MKKRNIRGFFEGEKGQRIFNYFYSIGAAVVIVGALFKLLKWPYADPMLIIGMGTEALIFFLSAFDNPARDYKWERVFSDLDNEEAEGIDLAKIYAQIGTGQTVEVSKKNESGLINAKNDAAGLAMPNLVHVNAAAVNKAGEATVEYIKQLTELNNTLTKLQNSLQQNIQGLNAMYELQLRDAGSQLESVKKVHIETEQMSKTIAELNAKYARMVEAMK